MESAQIRQQCSFNTVPENIDEDLAFHNYDFIQSYSLHSEDYPQHSQDFQEPWNSSTLADMNIWFEPLHMALAQNIDR